MGKNYMAQEKEKKRKDNIKDNKMVDSLITKIKRWWIVIIGDLDHSNPLLTQIKRHGIIKCKKVKFGAYQGSHSVLFLLWDFLWSFSSLWTTLISMDNQSLYPEIGWRNWGKWISLFIALYSQVSWILPKILSVNTRVWKKPLPQGTS